MALPLSSKRRICEKIAREQLLYNRLSPQLQTSGIAVPHYHILYRKSDVLICRERLTAQLLHALSAQDQHRVAKQLVDYLVALHSCNIAAAQQ
jgi:hypothetical protein